MRPLQDAFPFDGPSGDWKRSSYCSSGGCVEVKKLDDGGVAVRDAKIANGPVLAFDALEWRSFLAGARAGEFDV